MSAFDKIQARDKLRELGWRINTTGKAYMPDSVIDEARLALERCYFNVHDALALHLLLFGERQIVHQPPRSKHDAKKGADT